MIGVIGGNGVAATNKLCQLIEDLCVKNGAFRDAHHPEMIIYQATQVPSRSMFLEGRGESFIPGYVNCGLQLKQCGCDELCMCCNTAHFAIGELTEKIGLPFIDIILEVAKRIKQRGYKRAFVMCSDGCRLTGLYDKITEVSESTKVIYPDDEHQKLVTLGICNAKNSKRYECSHKEHPAHLFSIVCNWFIDTYNLTEHDCIVGGCTDICNCFCPSNYNGIDYIDSLSVLAETIYHHHCYQIASK